MEPVRFGLVGYGFGGRYFHAPLLAAAPECRLLGVVTSSAERRALLAEEHPDAATFGSLAELAAAGAEAVAISTPADTHSALTDAALDLGLAVVCDKPFALDAAAARASAERADRLGLALAPYQNRRWDSDFLTVRRAGGRRRARHGDPLRVPVRAFAPDPGPPAPGRRHAARLRRAPGRPGAGAARPGRRRLRRVAACGTAAWTTTSSWPSPRLRRHARTCGAAGAQAAPGARFRVTGTAGSYVVGGRWTARRPRSSPARPPPPLGDALGRRADAALGPAAPRRRPASRCRSERGALGHLLPGVRGRGPRARPAAGRPADAVASLTVLDAARRSATERVVVPLG